MLQPPGALQYCSGCDKNLERTQGLFTKPQLGVTYYQVVALLLAGWSMVRLSPASPIAGQGCPRPGQLRPHTAAWNLILLEP